MAKKECVVCGQEHPRCNGHKKGTPVRPCMVWPRDMENACRLHGGNHPAARAKGEEARALKKLEADASAVLGYSLDGKVPDLLGAMEGLAALAIAQVEAMGARVNALAERGRFGSLRYESNIGTEQLRAEVALLERSMDRAGKMLELVAKHKPDGEAAAAVNLLTSLSETIHKLDVG